ncbi:MAG: hypothetical protein IT429_24895 [Gemmataceae bacterium]|nr:hypothetical protein [Gemmataceae bacterium]
MECRNARLLLEFARPGGSELEREEAETLEQHLHECPDCAALASAERRADDRLGRAMRDVPVPDGLRERLLRKLAQERDAWYRRWLLRGAGLAAAVLLAVWGWSWWPANLPAVTSQDVDELVNAGPSFSRDKIHEGFEVLGTAFQAPPDFKYDLATAFGMVPFKNRQVPQLVFTAPGSPGRRPAMARVYVLSGQMFDLEQTKRNVGNPSGTHPRVEILDYPEHPNYLYLVVYTGELSLFRNRRAAET